MEARLGVPQMIVRWRWQLGLLSIVATGACLRLWRLDHNGYGTEYYAAGVRSMMQSAHNFFFNAFDPAGFISLDKPPVAFWIQVASAKLFGFSGLSILLPQVLEGVAAIVLLFHLVQRRFGPPAGLLAALCLALTPLSVAVDRSSNTDSCLVLTLLLAAWALLKAAERGSLGWLCAATGIVGIGFNVKMAAAFVVLPAFVLAYGLTAPLSWLRRVGHLAVASVMLVVVSLSWVIAYDLTPADQRPFAGSTRGNSMLELALIQYGVDRMAAREIRLAVANRQPRAAEEPSQPLPVRSTLYAMRVAPGPLRLADPYLSAQIGWLMPLALFGIIAAMPFRPRAEPRAAHADLPMWSGWAIACGVAFSAAEGVFHTYYLVTMAPPLCALAAIGLVRLWSSHRQGGAVALWLPAALVLTALWQANLQYGHVAPLISAWWAGRRPFADLLLAPDAGWLCGIYLALIIGTIISTTILAHAAIRQRGGARLSPFALGGCLLVLLVTPALWALSPVLGRVDVWFPAADVALLAPDRRLPPRLRGPHDPARLITFLQANHNGERYLLGTVTAIQAAPIIIRTGAPVMAIGGYNGADPILTPAELSRLARDGQLRFVLANANVGTTLGRRNQAAVRAHLDWLRNNGTVVDPQLWQSPDATADGRRRPERGNDLQLFDLRARDTAP